MSDRWELKGCPGDGPGFRRMADGEGQIRVGLVFGIGTSLEVLYETTTQSLLAFSLPGARHYLSIL